MEKPLEIVMTAAFQSKISGIELMAYVQLVRKHFSRKKHDFYIFEYEDGKMTMSVEAYDLDNIGQEEPEKCLLETMESLETPTFWCKIDDQGDFYLGTFLLPEDY